MLNRFAFIFSFFMVFVMLAKAQDGPILGEYSLTHTEDKVYISCTINQGFMCNGINVLRSTDSVNFEYIGDIAGICGSLTAPSAYRYIDEQPVYNSKSFYRLELNGLMETTPLKAHLVKYSTEDVLIFPNPAIDKVNLYFNKKNSGISTISLYGIDGTFLRSITTHDDYSIFDISDLSNGIYFVSVSDKEGNKTHLTKLQVFR